MKFMVYAVALLTLSLSSISHAKLHLAVSVTWEGESLEKTNIESLQKFRKHFDHLPLLHFISADYFLDSFTLSTTQSTQRIQSVLHHNDAIGLRLHSSQDLTEESGVPPRKSPTFWGDCRQKCGKAVPLDAWSTQDIRAMIHTAQHTLNEYGITTGPWFLAPGWLATPKVLSAARSTGYTHDFSEISPKIVQEKLRHYPLQKWLQQLWPTTTEFTQPHRLPTQHGWIREMGQNLGTVDYQTMKHLLKTFESYVELQKMTPDKDYFLHLGLYQETALHTAPKLAAVLKKMIKTAQHHDIKLDFYQPHTKSQKIALQEETTSKTIPYERHPPHSRH